MYRTDIVADSTAQSKLWNDECISSHEDPLLKFVKKLHLFFFRSYNRCTLFSCLNAWYQTPPTPFFFPNTSHKYRSWWIDCKWINPSELPKQRLYFFFFSHDTVAEVKSQNVTSVVGGCLSLPQNSSRALKLLTIIQLSQVIHHLLQPPSPFLKTWGCLLFCKPSP